MVKKQTNVAFSTEKQKSRPTTVLTRWYLFRVCLCCAHIARRILGICSTLPEHTHRPSTLTTQPHSIQKVTPVKVGASGRKSKRKHLQMRSICCQSTQEFKCLSSRVTAEKQRSMKGRGDCAVTEPRLGNIGFVQGATSLLQQSALTHGFTWSAWRFLKDTERTGAAAEEPRSLPFN